MSVSKTLKIVDPVTRRHLTMLLYQVLEKQRRPEEVLPNYGNMHKAAKHLQDLLVEKYGCTLGYEFNDPSIYDIWDNEFQKDIERYDAMGKVVDNADLLVAKGYYSHELKLREPCGSFLLKTTARCNLERQFGNLEDLIKEIRAACTGR